MTRLRVFSPASGIVSFVNRLENITDQLARLYDFSLPKYVIPVSV